MNTIINLKRRSLIKSMLAGSSLGLYYHRPLYANGLMTVNGTGTGTNHHDSHKTNTEPRNDVLISSADDEQGNHYLVRYHTLTGELNQWKIENRGHGSQVTHDKKFSLMMARRPGTKAYIQSLEFVDKPFEFSSRPNRHFYGHAVYADNGRYLLTTENDYINNKSVIGVRDVFDDYKWIDELDAFGVGCHELALLNDGKTLVVANGGIITNPNQPRKKLNLDSMDSSLVYMDIQSGNILAEYFLDDPQMSIRHLDVSNKDEVVIACQHESSDNAMIPMMYFHQGESALQPAQLEDDFYWITYQNYTASVCQHDNGVVAISTPKGDKISFWNRSDKTLLSESIFRDVSGVATTNDGQYFIATSGRGEIRYYDAVTLKEETRLQQRLENVRWDNHLTVL